MWKAFLGTDPIGSLGGEPEGEGLRKVARLDHGFAKEDLLWTDPKAPVVGVVVSCRINIHGIYRVHVCMTVFVVIRTRLFPGVNSSRSLTRLSEPSPSTVTGTAK